MLCKTIGKFKVAKEQRHFVTLIRFNGSLPLLHFLTKTRITTAAFTAGFIAMTTLNFLSL